MKKKLGNYFDESQSEDIFDYIPPQKTNQIFTPKHLVMKMVDMLEEESPGCFDDPDKTFIDLYMKSGLYVAEIVKRLFRSEAMKARFPQAEERLRHIFAHQVYGLAPTEIIYRIACAFVLGFDEELRIERHHLARFDALPAVKDGTLEEAWTRFGRGDRDDGLAWEASRLAPLPLNEWRGLISGMFLCVSCAQADERFMVGVSAFFHGQGSPATMK
ncbi:MAG: hypothetical protein ACLT38_01985 [Akkermansia sp.]